MSQQRHIITISGPPGSGTSTLTEHLVSRRNYEVLSGGDMFRSLADERDMSLEELTQQAEEDDAIDRELDNRIKEEMERHITGERDTETDVLVVESRLAGWFAPDEAFKIWIDAPLPVRAARTEDRDETVEELKRREESDANRYREYYDIDITSRRIYNLVIDTENIGSESVAEIVLEAVDAAFFQV